MFSNLSKSEGGGIPHGPVTPKIDEKTSIEKGKEASKEESGGGKNRILRAKDPQFRGCGDDGVFQPKTPRSPHLRKTSKKRTRDGNLD